VTTKQEIHIEKPRCPYCHEDIKIGGDNYACHECMVWHHTACWTEHGECVACGNLWMKSPMGGLSATKPIFGAGSYNSYPDDRPRWSGGKLTDDGWVECETSDVRKKLDPVSATLNKGGLKGDLLTFGFILCAIAGFGALVWIAPKILIRLIR